MATVTKTLKFYVTHDDMGYIVMKAAESLPSPDCREVTNPREHITAGGIASLKAGGQFVFSSDDQSYPQLEALFHAE